MSPIWLPVLLLIGISQSTALEKGLYSGHQVWSVIPKDDTQVEDLHQLNMQIKELEYWKEARHPGDEAQIMVPSTKIAVTRDRLKEGGFHIEIVMNNIESVVSDEMSDIMRRRFSRFRKAMDYDEYHGYDEIMKIIDNMVKRCPVKQGILCDTYTIGQTFEGRDLKVFRMYKDKPDRPVFWVDSLIHAREWLAGATNLKIANHLITSYATDFEARMLLDDGDWHFLFVHNPDGYVFSWTNERMWRKNRYDNSLDRNTSCIGVDLNRNFGFRWGNAGNSYHPCSLVYRGLTAASELETKSVQEEIKSLSKRLKGFVSIHAAISMVLSAFGSLTDPNDRSTCEYLPEPKRSKVEVVTANMTKAIDNTFDYSFWRGGNTCATIYPASGGSADYAAEYGTCYSFTIEVRDRDADQDYYGFLAPATEIDPSFREVWNGIVTMVKSINEVENKN